MVMRSVCMCGFPGCATVRACGVFNLEKLNVNLPPGKWGA